MKREAGSSRPARGVERILELADEQARQLALGDLEAASAVQQRRQELLEEVQGLDDLDPAVRRAIRRILDRDRRTIRLLLAEQADILSKLQRISSLRKLLKGRRRRATPDHAKLSTRA